MIVNVINQSLDKSDKKFIYIKGPSTIHQKHTYHFYPAVKKKSNFIHYLYNTQYTKKCRWTLGLEDTPSNTQKKKKKKTWSSSEPGDQGPGEAFSLCTAYRISFNKVYNTNLYWTAGRCHIELNKNEYKKKKNWISQVMAINNKW